MLPFGANAEVQEHLLGDRAEKGRGDLAAVVGRTARLVDRDHARKDGRVDRCITHEAWDVVVLVVAARDRDLRGACLARQAIALDLRGLPRAFRHDPFEQALFAMVQLPYLQPFEDVNKRVSRLAANIPLVKRNLSPLSFVDVPVETYVLGVLGVHELNRVDLLKDVFLWAYERSAARYGAIRQSIGEPDLFRLRHRQALRQVVAAVIRAPMNQKIAARHIATWAVENVVEIDRSRFVETAETELIGLHDGNYARYQVRPSEYAAWREGWDFKPVTARPALAAKRKSRSP